MASLEIGALGGEVSVLLVGLAILAILALIVGVGLPVAGWIGRRAASLAVQAQAAEWAALREELGRSEARLQAELQRQESRAEEGARALREEVARSLRLTGETVGQSVGRISEAQQGQLVNFATELGKLRDSTGENFRGFHEAVTARLAESRQHQSDALAAVVGQMEKLVEHNERRIGVLQDSVTERLGESRQQQAEALATVVERLEKLIEHNERRLGALQDSVTERLGESRQQQAESLAAIAGQMGKLTEYNEQRIGALQDSMTARLGESRQQQAQALATVVERLEKLIEHNDRRLGALQEGVEKRLGELREDNRLQLERMRATVDEKLHETLETRLGESFRIVSDRLEAVHKGLGEMQTLANGVGDLKRVLTNVKTRGTWGEIQLGALLEQVLAPEQYAANVATRPGSPERVEYAIRLPGRGEHGDETVWLPIDAKFPQEDYQRLLLAQEQGDTALVQEAGKRLEAQVRLSAKTIAGKYLEPPVTTDFAILFLPIEGLYAEVVRRPGLVESLQREQRIVLAGPTTLAALLNSLQMGFRSLAVERRSSEVWALLGAVKGEFHKFGDLLEKVHRKLGEASNSIDVAARKSRTIERRLRKVEVLPEPESSRGGLLGDGEDDFPDPD